MINTSFDDIRPYVEEEIAPAMQRIAASEYLPLLAQYIFPEKEVEEVRNIVRQIRTTHEFQTQVMYYFNQTVIKKSAASFTYKGLEYLDPEKSYLFISNHRDIMLDSALMQYMLYCNGFKTTEITFGDNLMSSQLIIDIGKSNKMFKVVRGGNMRDFYSKSLQLSEYLRHTIMEKNESIWIAQRGGRTKDGNDSTDQGIIKMFCMSDARDPVRAAGRLNIVPVAMSYEIEPCEILKTRELYLSRNHTNYIKQIGEDLNSILTGITQQKGHIHICLGEPIRYAELEAIEYNQPNEFYKAIASLIDRRIHKNYKLYNNNYIAYDIRSGTDIYASNYTAEEKTAYTERMEQMLHYIDGDRDVLTSIFLSIYANPVVNSQ
ncbi:MAG: 1-acyl-sn-glycerol-3-phosphate acyltransferase [Tannerella sp.]|jgi:hypothetical protein|nr:1-acyl-sn-glycerol-3-phosphate acyltransferase [Tannerella sp.]